jgi:hypothetical protein
MPLSFPANPTTGQTYTFLSITYTYDGKKWSKSTGGSGGATVTVSVTTPASTTQGSLWLDSDYGDLSVYQGTGWTGISGAAGFTGSRGQDGVIGYNGSTGYTGSVGTGYTGSASTVPGYTGSVGVGYTGSAAAGGRQPGARRHDHHRGSRHG